MVTFRDFGCIGEGTGVMWTDDLHAEVLGEFESAQARLADLLRRNWWFAHSLYVLRKQQAKKRHSLRALRKRLFGRAAIECGNAKCRVRFVPYRGHTLYCSDLCRVRELALQAYYRRRKPVPARTCPVCEQVFSSRRRDTMYCSPRCRCVVANDNRVARERAAAVGLTRSCKRCGTSFTGRRSDARYCSTRCSRAGRWANRAARQRELYKRNRLRVLALQAAYRVANRERVNARQRAAHRRRKEQHERA